MVRSMPVLYYCSLKNYLDLHQEQILQGGRSPLQDYFPFQPATPPLALAREALLSCCWLAVHPSTDHQQPATAHPMSQATHHRYTALVPPHRSSTDPGPLVAESLATHTSPYPHVSHVWPRLQSPCYRSSMTAHSWAAVTCAHCWHNP